MFLHELSRRISQEWSVKVDGESYAELVRKLFGNRCPYCTLDLADAVSVIEHLDGMNRYRAGLHVPGNVLVACRRCNSEKRRDDSGKVLSLASSGWESFLCHDGSRCAASCLTCHYWKSIWENELERTAKLNTNIDRIRSFRRSFPEFEHVLPLLAERLPALLTKLYSDCQTFAEAEITSLLKGFEEAFPKQVQRRAAVRVIPKRRRG